MISVVRSWQHGLDSHAGLRNDEFYGYVFVGAIK